MTKYQLEILQHALGVNQYGQGEQFRNYFCSGDGCDIDPTCKSLVEIGFMAIYPRRGDCTDYYVTDAGKAEMLKESPKPPKLTPGQKRYRHWLRISDCCPDLTFGEFLKRGCKIGS